MKRRTTTWVLATVALVTLTTGQFANRAFVQEVEASKSNWAVYFSPRGGITEALVKSLAEAQSTILVQAYSFTSEPIAKALLDAHKRGVIVEILLDKSQRSGKYSSADFFTNAGMTTRIDAGHAIAHNKVMIVDREIVITGSFNFTKAAEQKNAENLLVIHDRDLAARYEENWQAHKVHSEIYIGNGQR